MRHAANKIRRTANMAGAVPYRLLDEASWATQGCVLPSSALQSPSLLAGRLLLASVGAPALPRRQARFLRRAHRPTDWLGPDPARFDCPAHPRIYSPYSPIHSRACAFTPSISKSRDRAWPG